MGSKRYQFRYTQICPMKAVSAWGRLSAEPHRTIAPSDPAALAAALRRGPLPGLAHGMGRSYGDVALNPCGTLWMAEGLDRFIAFDPATGLLSCEAGVLLRDIQRSFAPRGWMLPVTPGTQLATVGGAIANDVHGKNHHALGSFGDHVARLRLLRTTGEAIDCGPDENPEWFAATVGGLGLTGVIASAQLRLRRVDGPWLEVDTVPYQDLDAFFELADSSEKDWEYTVSWIDCLSAQGKGIFIRGNHSPEQRPPPRARERRMPVTPPVSLVNRLTLGPFNSLYYRLQAGKAGRSLTHYEPFFYPLDGLLEWNRMYGPKGFYQYQSVVPRAAGRQAVQDMLAVIARSGLGSFLAVLKTFGERAAPGLLSFAAPGVTLALDFPNLGDRTYRLFDELDAIVRAAGGRIYPAKDARMTRDMFREGYPALERFLPFRDPGISSAFSRRVIGF